MTLLTIISLWEKNTDYSVYILLFFNFLKKYYLQAGKNCTSMSLQTWQFFVCLFICFCFCFFTKKLGQNQRHLRRRKIYAVKHCARPGPLSSGPVLDLVLLCDSVSLVPGSDVSWLFSTRHLSKIRGRKLGQVRVFLTLPFCLRQHFSRVWPWKRMPHGSLTPRDPGRACRSTV